MKNLVRDFTLTCGLLNRHMKCHDPLEIMRPDDGGSCEVKMLDLNTSRERVAQQVTFTCDGISAYASFDSLMDFDQFECALVSHGFVKAFDY